MKITKRQLKRIIREEKAKLIAENRLRRNIRRRLKESIPTHPEDRGQLPPDWQPIGRRQSGGGRTLADELVFDLGTSDPMEIEAMGVEAFEAAMDLVGDENKALRLLMDLGVDANSMLDQYMGF